MTCEGRLGEALQDLRGRRGLSLSEAARRSGLPKSTLQHWEADRSVPRGASYARLLDALEPEPRLRTRLLVLAGPAYARAELARLPLGAPVDLGAVLRTMRTRRGITQAELARTAGVTQGAVARWESGDATPSAERIHALAHALGASAEEAVALAAVREGGPRAFDWKEPADAIQSAQTAWRGLSRSLQDALALAHEAEVWRRATRDPRWDSALCHALSWRAVLDYENGAPGLGEGAARRAIGLARTTETREAAMSALDVATMMDRRRRVDPAQALELATEWAGTLRAPILKAWALTIRAHRLASLGRAEAAHALVDEIHGLVLEGGKPDDGARLERWTIGISLHLAAGQPRRALDTFDVRPDPDTEKYQAVRALLANDRVAPDDLVQSLRELWSRPEALWMERERLGRLLRRQAKLTRRA